MTDDRKTGESELVDDGGNVVCEGVEVVTAGG
jgi:hypothetical protein